MTVSRWNRLKIGDVLEGASSSRKYVVGAVERTMGGKVTAISLISTLVATSSSYWKVVEKDTIKELESL